MSASLVGSEMCIRDRFQGCAFCWKPSELDAPRTEDFPAPRISKRGTVEACLLYTSDAADDM
eukprot:912494-Alexandrium_andersonii.AAC.1